MPCPPDRPIADNGQVSAYGCGSAAAVAAAIAAVPGAATEAARSACDCPESCPFASPYGINYTVESTSYSYLSGMSLIVDLFTLGTTALFDDGFYCRGTATFSWSATAHCAERVDGANYEIARQRDR